jgi:hypothetical protein
MHTVSSYSHLFALCQFVTANINFFVKADTFAHLNAIAGGSTIIPCTVTSPELVPTFNNASDDVDEEKVIN